MSPDNGFDKCLEPRLTTPRHLLLLLLLLSRPRFLSYLRPRRGQNSPLNGATPEALLLSPLYSFVSLESQPSSQGDAAFRILDKRANSHLYMNPRKHRFIYRTGLKWRWGYVLTREGRRNVRGQGHPARDGGPPTKGPSNIMYSFIYIDSTTV